MYVGWLVPLMVDVVSFPVCTCMCVFVCGGGGGGGWCLLPLCDSVPPYSL